MIFKNMLHFLAYQVRHGQIRLVSFSINLLILLIAIFQIGDLLAVQSIAWLLLLIFFNIVWQLIGTFGDFAACFRYIPLEEKHIDPDFNRLQISEKEKTLGYILVRNGASGALVSATVNAMLQTGTEPGCSIDDSRRKMVEESIKRHYATMLLFLKCRLQYAAATKGFYNEKKLCLSVDLEPKKALSFHRSNYYNTHVTNKTYFSILYDAAGHEIRSPLFQEYGYSLPSLGTSVMSDEIGVSTIGFTQDGYILILHQGIGANASPGLLVPTGSGSADWSDYRRQGFFDTICAATNRELFEEIGKPKPFGPDTVAKTKVIGFFRWVNFGGKPEFVSVSSLNVDCRQIIPEKMEQMPTLRYNYILDRDSRKVNYDMLNEFLDDIMANGQCSFPLYVNALVLKDYFSSNREEFEAFLFR